MGKIVHITMENFKSEVLEPSMGRAVVLDFWAEWCGPCKQLTPLLEKLSVELDFVLAKIDTEANPELAQHFRISSIPDIRVVYEGQIVDGFQGVVPEAQIREMLNKYLVSPLDRALEQAIEMIEAGATAQVIEPLNQMAQQFPKEKKIQFWLAKALIAEGRTEEAEALLNTFTEGDDFFTQAKALLDLRIFAEHALLKSESELDDIYIKGCQAAINQEYESALRFFLELVKTDRSFREDAGRTSMITLFGIMGPKDPLTKKFKQLLSMYIFY